MREVLIRGDAAPDPVPDPPGGPAENPRARTVEARVIDVLARLQGMDPPVQLRAMEFLAAFRHYALQAVASCDRKDVALDLVARERRRLLRALLDLERQARQPTAGPMPSCPRCGGQMVGGAPHGPWPVQYECRACGYILVPPARPEGGKGGGS